MTLGYRTAFVRHRDWQNVIVIIKGKAVISDKLVYIIAHFAVAFAATETIICKVVVEQIYALIRYSVKRYVSY